MFCLFCGCEVHVAWYARKGTCTSICFLGHISPGDYTLVPINFFIERSEVLHIFQLLIGKVHGGALHYTQHVWYLLSWSMLSPRTQSHQERYNLQFTNSCTDNIYQKNIIYTIFCAFVWDHVRVLLAQERYCSIVLET